MLRPIGTDIIRRWKDQRVALSGRGRNAGRPEATEARDRTGAAGVGSSGAAAAARATSQQPAGQSLSPGSGFAAVASSQSSIKEVEATAAEGRGHWKILVPAAVFLVAALIGGGLYLRPRSPTGLTEKDTIVLADFDNTTGDAVFDDH